MNQSNIYTIGEIILDIIFKDNKPLSANPGGSKLNSAITLGRLGLPVSFIGETGNDEVAVVIAGFLRKNGVSTKYLNRVEGLKSSLALAFLNEDNEARYSFYKFNPENGLRFELPTITENDYLLFGSFFSINKEYHDILFDFVSKSKQNKVLVIYDPNLRKPHKDKIPELMKLIGKNISAATIVRASDEDMFNILGSDNPSDAFSFVKECGCNNLIITKSGQNVIVFTKDSRLQFDVRAIDPVSTIGAGDTFNAAIIYWLFKNQIHSHDIDTLNPDQWKEMINIAIMMSQSVCMSIENYLPLNEINLYKTI